MIAFFEGLLDILYPPRCPFCDKILEWKGAQLCAKCQGILPWTDDKPHKVDFCEACLSPLWYRDGVVMAIWNYKYYMDMGYHRVLGEFMYQCLHDRWSEPVDGVTWIPLSKQRKGERGYDQAELLARRVSELSGLPLISTLKKVRNTGPQSHISEESSRRANVLGAYVTLPEARVEGLRLVLVDDVLTTGATMSECASCLLMAGAKSVVGLTAVRAGNRKKNDGK